MASTITIVPPAKSVKLHPIEGVGAQFNTNIFITRAQPRRLTPAQLAELRAAISELKLGHCRIFVKRGLRPDLPAGRKAPEYQALMRTIELAQGAAASVNLTYWGQGPYANAKTLAALVWPNKDVQTWPQKALRKWPPELTDPHHPNAITEPRILMEQFALLISQARERFDCVTHATIQNEVNGEGTDIAKQRDPGLSMRLYERLYRDLDTALRAFPDPTRPQAKGRSLRDVIKLVAGDLVESKNQDDWLAYLYANMEVPRPQLVSVLDGYSIHVYWQPGAVTDGFPVKPHGRLQNLQKTLGKLGSDRPTFVTEYGVRNLSANPKPGVQEGKKLEQSPLAAFQHAWFNAVAPQYGLVGLTKWVLYRPDVIADGWGEWGMIDTPKSGFTRSPAFAVTRLFNALVPPGWTFAGSGRSQAGGANLWLSRFASPNGAQESVVVLNAAAAARQVRVKGLVANRRYFAAAWNADGAGQLVALPRVAADAAGAATVDVSAHAVVALASRSIAI